jgi:hypothetical protein
MPRGRPTKLTPAVVKQVAEAFLYGFSDEETALLAGIDERTIRRARAGNFCPAIKRAEAARKAEYINRITEGTRPDWARWAWFLERRFPREFSKPEIQLSVNSNVINNTLIVTAEVAHQMGDRVKEADAKVTKLFEAKQPGPGVHPFTKRASESKNANGN